MDRIIATTSGPIGSIVFDHPERRNALTLEMSIAAAEAIERFDNDETVRAIVLSGSGDKAFISGGDISKFESQRANATQVKDYNRRASAFRARVRRTSKPTIAMIRGYCLGGGLAVALTCDVRIAAADARFGIPAARLGIGYASEGLRDLIQVVSPSVAKDILFTGRQLLADEALRVGLVNHVLPPAALADFVTTYAETIATNAPLSVHAAKTVIGELARDAGQRDDALCARVVASCFDSEDYVEGRRAFMEKRKPVFTGR